MQEQIVTGSIVTYNNGKIIERCIASILEQTKGCRFRLYVYDNCSSDDTVSKIRSGFPQVKVIEGKANKGFGYGHNQVIKRVKSQYHAVINPDIFLDTDVITQMAEYMAGHPEIGILMPKVLNPDGTEQHLPKRQPNFKYVILSKFKKYRYYRDEYTRAGEDICAPVKCENISGSFFVADTAALKQLNGFDERYFMYFEDADLGKRMAGIKEIVYHPDYYVYHEWKRDNTKSFKGIRIFLTSMVKYILKWKTF